MNVERTQKILNENAEVAFGIFGVVESAGIFPPRDLLNEFLMQGYDPCDQDGRMKKWQPFQLEDYEYEEILIWWCSTRKNVTVKSLGVGNWADWSAELVEAV